MRLRPSNRGPAEPAQFWGCSEYSVTGCRGKREVDEESLAARSAGASAQDMFDERRRRHLEAVKLVLPGVTALSLIGMVLIYLVLVGINGALASIGVVVVGVLAAFAVTRLPPEANAWRRGAQGERKTSHGLVPLEHRDFVVLHDRRIPGARANIDHIAIGPQGVFVVESKYWSGAIEVVNNKLFIADRERQNVVDQIYQQAIATQIALSEPLNRLRLTVTPILCIHGARLPWFDKKVAGIRLIGARELKNLAEAPVVLEPAQVQELATLADKLLRPMY